MARPLLSARFAGAVLLFPDSLARFLFESCRARGRILAGMASAGDLIICRCMITGTLVDCCKRLVVLLYIPRSTPAYIA